MLFSFSSSTYFDPKKAPRTPKRGKDKSSDRDDLVSIVSPSFKNKNLIEALKDFSPDFAASSECSSCKCQDCKAKHDGVINAINALTASIKKMTSKRGVIPSKRISYPDTPLEIKAAKRRTSKDEEKVEPASLGEWKNYPFKEFNISDEAPKKLTHLINDYSEWIVDGLLKYHAGRKQNDERYKVNESILGFDMFDFVVAHPRTKNWFYVMSQPQTCWNDVV
ncbi:hypothetical protein T459_10107 [Capsicum annuum]|uniref:Uncharacterized protein n=1 Tax=Capsicum annuum TaxID=4072 RepID=A0A2G3A1C9_CAPAN|nr:hypothetical protein T459_10107 [Capsicum annuum]